jgi:hypothetical protein
MNDENEFNTRIIFWIAFIALIIGGIIFAFPSKPVVKNEPVVIVDEPVKIEYVYITVQPTPDGKTYFASEYESGIRKLGREFSFIRYNTTGYKTTSIHANVYDYRVFNSYHWFNPEDYKYYEEYPSKLGKKFLFVFAYIYADDVIGDDTRVWIPTTKSYAVQCQNKMYYPISFMEQLRIKELEDVYNSNDDYRIGYYNTVKMYSEEGNRDTAGEYTQSIDVLKGGKSNKIDGYIVFEIDKEDKLEDLTVHADYFAFGKSSWKIKT